MLENCFVVVVVVAVAVFISSVKRITESHCDVHRQLRAPGIRLVPSCALSGKSGALIHLYVRTRTSTALATPTPHIYTPRTRVLAVGV